MFNMIRRKPPKPVFPVSFQDDLVSSGSLYADQAEQIKREQMEMEEKMSRELAQQRAQQTALLMEKLAQRKKERMRKLKEQQELEKAKVTKLTAVDALQCFSIS